MRRKLLVLLMESPPFGLAALRFDFHRVNSGVSLLTEDRLGYYLNA